MTLSHRVRVAVFCLIAALGITYGSAWIGYTIAHAQGSGSETAALPDAGSASAPVAAKPLPSSQLADPLESPQQAYNDLLAAKRLGWSLLVLAVLIMACRLAGKLGGWFKPLATGRVAVVVAAAGAIAVAAYNALALGGTWMSAGAAALVAFAVYWNSTAQPKKAAEGN